MLGSEEEGDEEEEEGGGRRDKEVEGGMGREVGKMK